MSEPLTFLLFQVRNPEDPMRENEVLAFARALHTTPDRIRVVDLLRGAEPSDLHAVDVVLFGGSGEYSATADAPWLDAALELMRDIHQQAQPTFASCWGFQAMARALGGRVVHDPQRAELGTRTVHLTQAGLADPVFGPLGPRFFAQMGHEDRVERLPADAVCLAYSDRVPFQAYRFADRPIYCTQFHPELTRDDLIARVRAYPQYVKRIAGVSLEEFCRTTQETRAAATLLPRFVRWALG